MMPLVHEQDQWRISLSRTAAIEVACSKSSQALTRRTFQVLSADFALRTNYHQWPSFTTTTAPTTISHAPGRFADVSGA